MAKKVNVKTEDRSVLEEAVGEIVGEGKHPTAAISTDDLKVRLARSPEEQYYYMYDRYKKATDPEAFLNENTVSSIVMANTFVRRPSGTFRIKKFLTEAEFQGAADAYFELIHEQAQKGGEAIPDVEQLALFLGTTRSTLMTWRKDISIGMAVELALNRIATIKKQLGMTGKIPPLVYLSDVQNNHGYQDKRQVQHETFANQQIADRTALIEGAKLLPG